ncbi:MAG TPA: hypothetical protein ENH80_07950 [Phycisphaerae bacterium]|nr:hypothetical protein [Phycisphaerae bacterium]HDZ43856.1 hypothetical protein [Phycisphaerae bacterium]
MTGKASPAGAAVFISSLAAFPSAATSGWVVCGETDQPIEGAHLFVAAFADDMTPEEAGDAEKNSCNIAFSGPDGQFEVLGLADRSHRVFVIHDQCVEVEWIPVEIPPIEPFPIRLERGRVITGHVLDRRGRPDGEEGLTEIADRWAKKRFPSSTHCVIIAAIKEGYVLRGTQIGK